VQLSSEGEYEKITLKKVFDRVRGCELDPDASENVQW
jgi:hypothetical protein